MRIWRIHSNLWRLENNGKVKDVKVLNRDIIEPENPHNKLTEEETIEFLKQII